MFASEHPETLADVARALRADPATVQREVTRLERAGIFRTARAGRNRVVAPDPDSPIHDELAALLAKAFGAPAALEKALAAVDGIDRAFIFGSWARRFHGEPGPLPRDVDVLVVGDIEPSALYDAVRPVEEELRVEINPLVVSPTEWKEPRGLAGRIERGALVELKVGDADDR